MAVHDKTNTNGVFVCVVATVYSTNIFIFIHVKILKTEKPITVNAGGSILYVGKKHRVKSSRHSIAILFSVVYLEG